MCRFPGSTFHRDGIFGEHILWMISCFATGGIGKSGSEGFEYFRLPARKTRAILQANVV